MVKKVIKMFWRGSTMGEVPHSSRLDNLAQAQWINYHYDDNYIDIAFSNVV